MHSLCLLSLGPNRVNNEKEPDSKLIVPVYFHLPLDRLQVLYWYIATCCIFDEDGHGLLVEVVVGIPPGDYCTRCLGMYTVGQVNRIAHFKLVGRSQWLSGRRINFGSRRSRIDDH